MKIKFLSTVVLLFVIHLSPMVTSCGPGRCDDAVDIFASVENAEVMAYSFDQETSDPIFEAPFDRRKLRLSIALTYPDSLEEDRYFPQKAGLMSGAFATSPCIDYPEIILTEYITQIEILVVNETDESTQDISAEFLAVVFGNQLYQEIPEFLVKEDRYEMNLVYQPIAEGESQKWIVNTTLSDNRVMRDTLNFSLQ